LTCNFNFKISVKGQLIQFGFIPSSGSEEDFQKCQIFHQSESMAAILDVGQCHWTQLRKRTIQWVSHLCLVQFGFSGSWEEDQNVKLTDYRPRMPDNKQWTWN